MCVEELHIEPTESGLSTLWLVSFFVSMGLRCSCLLCELYLTFQFPFLKFRAYNIM